MSTADPDNSCIVSGPADIQQIFVTTTTSDSDAMTSQDSIIPTSEIYEGDASSLTLKSELTEVSKATNIQLLADPGSNPELYSQSQEFDAGILGSLQQGQIIGDADGGHVLELVGNDGQTVQIKIEGIQNLLSLTSSSAGSQTE